MERGDIVSLNILIPATTGLCKPLTYNTPESLAPMLGYLTDKVNHSRLHRGPARPNGSNVPMIDVLELVTPSASPPICPFQPPSIHSSTLSII